MSVQLSGSRGEIVQVGSLKVRSRLAIAPVRPFSTQSERSESERAQDFPGSPRVLLCSGNVKRLSFLGVI